MKKSELRTHCLERRSSLTFGQISESNRRITDLFFSSIDLVGVSRFHSFIPIEKFLEVDTLPIFRHIWARYPEIETLAPRLNFEIGEIESVRFTHESALIENKWGIKEPAAESQLDAAAIDIAVVPLLCFDVRGHRVGYGRGFYDRFLAKCRKDCKKIGLSFFSPVDPIEDVGDHDITLDVVVTPDRLFRPRE
jgi:5-formyltetrahydrofolate cyclo-ligase